MALPIYINSGDGTVANPGTSVSKVVNCGTRQNLAALILVVGDEIAGAADDITSVTAGGAAATFLGKTTTGDRFLYAYGKTGIGTGNQTFAAACTASHLLDISVLILAGVDSFVTGEVVTGVTVAAADTKTTSVTIAASAMLVTFEQCYAGGGNPTGGENATLRLVDADYGFSGLFTSSTLAAGTHNVTTNRGSVYNKISHVIVPVIPASTAGPSNLWIDGVNQDEGDPGDGTTFLAAITAKGSASGSVLLTGGVANKITTTGLYTFPDRSAATDYLTIGVYNPDSVHASGTPIDEADGANCLQWVGGGSGSDPIWEMPEASKYVRFRGIEFDYGSRTGNTWGTTIPNAALSYGAAEQDAFLPADQPDYIEFDRCLLKDKAHTTTSFGALTHNGKTIRFVDCRPLHLTASSAGQGDGYWCRGDVGDGPWLIERCAIEDVGGESQGFGSHGQSSGAGTEGADPAGFPAFATANAQPLEEGYTLKQCQISSNVANRRVIYSGDTETVSVASKTFTVPDASTATGFTAAAAITALGPPVSATSATSNTIGTGAKTFTITTGKPYIAGDAVTFTATAGATGTMTGTVTSYDSGTGVMEINAASVTGSGTGTAWSLTIYMQMFGTVTSYTGTSLVMNVTSVDGSGSHEGWTISLDGTTVKYKNKLELTYGQDIVIEGNDFSTFWHDGGTQYYATLFKLSTMSRPSLDHVALRRIRIRYNVFRSLAQLVAFAEYTALSTNPVMDDIIIEHNIVFDLDVLKWGFAGNGAIISLGADMPSNVTVQNNFIDCPANLPTSGWLTAGTAGYAHPSIANFTGHIWRNNIFLLPGTQTYDVFGYYGTGPSGISSPAVYLANACTSPVFTHNSIVSVTGMDYGVWDDEAAPYYNHIYRDAGGRTTLKALLRDVDAASQADYDPRYNEGDEQTGHDGTTRGPDYWEVYQAMGWAWPFSWTPDAPADSGHARRRYIFLRRGGRRVRRR